LPPDPEAVVEDTAYKGLLRLSKLYAILPSSVGSITRLYSRPLFWYREFIDYYA